MIIHRGYDDLHLVKPVVTMGIFDGVHRGHRSLLEILVARAEETGGESVVITFSPHPRMVLQKDHLELSFLNTMDEKTSLLEKTGIDHLIIMEFSRQLSKTGACDFVKDVLVDKVGTRHLILGYDHRFGHMGEGDFNTIRECSERLNFAVEQVEGLRTREGEISSSSIREALLKGDIEKANEWLGYYYRLEGSVIGGRQIGRSLGFPTANLVPADRYKLIPGNGVYAVEVILKDRIFPGMLSIGFNPTVSSEAVRRSIEVHIINFSADIYGEKITLLFRKWLRAEKKFDSVRQLAEQMEIDRENTLKLLT